MADKLPIDCFYNRPRFVLFMDALDVLNKKIYSKEATLANACKLNKLSDIGSITRELSVYYEARKILQDDVDKQMHTLDTFRGCYTTPEEKE
jgi:hypothetical protein